MSTEPPYCERMWSADKNMFTAGAKSGSCSPSASGSNLLYPVPTPGYPPHLLNKTLAVNQRDPRPMTGSQPHEGGASEGEKLCCFVLTASVWFHLVAAESVRCLTVSPPSETRHGCGISYFDKNKGATLVVNKDMMTR